MRIYERKDGHNTLRLYFDIKQGLFQKTELVYDESPDGHRKTHDWKQYNATAKLDDNNFYPLQFIRISGGKVQAAERYKKYEFIDNLSPEVVSWEE